MYIEKMSQTWSWGRIAFRTAMVLLIVFAMCPLSVFQVSGATGDGVTIKTDYQLLGTSTLRGGGHVTWTVSGQDAVELRQAIIQIYDTDRDGRLDPHEVRNERGTGYINEVEHAIEGSPYWNAQIDRAEPVHANEDPDYLEIDAPGLVGTSNETSGGDIWLYMRFSAHATSGEKSTLLSDAAIAQALYEPVGMTYAGGVSFEHTDYRVGTGSFSNIRLETGKLHVLRTPAGEILMYKADFNAQEASVSDNAKYHSFNIIENPQVLFIVAFICVYLIIAIPNRFFYMYRKAHPRRYRSKAKKIWWVHLLNKIFVIVVLLFYFYPFVGFFFFSGLFIWIISIAFMVTSAVLGKQMYDKLYDDIPPEPEPTERRTRPKAKCNICLRGIEDLDFAIRCENCRRFYHDTCITNVKKCTSCGKTIIGEETKETEEKEKKEERKQQTIQCYTCGEVFAYLEGTPLIKVRCSACGIVQEKVETGLNYLLIGRGKDNAFRIFTSFLKMGSAGICISTTFPTKLKKVYNLKNTKVIWLSDTSSAHEALDPKRLEFETTRTISSFVKKNKNGVVMIDGFEYLVIENGFDKVLKFIKKINDIASVNEATLILPIDPDSLGSDELTVLRKEFDKVVDVEEEEEE